MSWITKSAGVARLQLASPSQASSTSLLATSVPTLEPKILTCPEARKWGYGHPLELTVGTQNCEQRNRRFRGSPIEIGFSVESYWASHVPFNRSNKCKASEYQLSGIANKNCICNSLQCCPGWIEHLKTSKVQFLGVVHLASQSQHTSQLPRSMWSRQPLFSFTSSQRAVRNISFAGLRMVFGCVGVVELF